MGQQQGLCGASRGRQLHRSLVLRIEGLDVGVKLQQQPGDGGVACLGRGVERGFQAPPPLDVSTWGKQIPVCSFSEETT